MDVKQQEYFIAIAEECSLSKAARRLYVSQPSLSQFLSKLESSMNVCLFNRCSNNALSLTEAGKLYYESAQQILQIRNDFMRKLTDLKNTSSTKLTFGINAERGVNILTHIMSELSGQYPNLRIEIRQHSAYELAELVANCEVDLAYSAFAEKNPKLEYIEFPAYEVALVLSTAHPLSHLGTTTPSINLPHMPLSCFQDEKFVMLKSHTVLRDIEDYYCEHISFKPNIKVETHNIATAFSIVENSTCVSLCPYNLIPDLKDTFSFIGLDPPLYYHTGFYYNKNIYHTKTMRDFLKVAKQLTISKQEI